MKKKSKKTKILVIALVVMILGLGGVTYAKYASKIGVSAQLDIAKWVFKVNGSTEQKQTIDLSNTLKPDPALLSNGKIAPGTHGEFKIEIDATGTDVGINYEVKLKSLSEKPKNLVFTCNGMQLEDFTDSINIGGGQIFTTQESKTKTFTIGWKWDYESKNNGRTVEENDIIDTQDSQNITDYKFEIISTGVQTPINY